MKKRIVSTIAGIIGFSAVYAAPQVSDVIDPIYETEQLPNSYYAKEKQSNSIIFANNKIPNLTVEVSFVKNNSRQFYEIVADYMYELEHSGSSITQCQNDPTYKALASYEFACVKDQDSLQYIVFTQFEDDNNQPSDFTRIISVSSKTGDNTAIEDLAAMVNTANYQLGFFENFNIPQKSVLTHASSVDYAKIDLEGMQSLSHQQSNLWKNALEVPASIQISSVDVTNQGMKFFLKDSATNQKYIITYSLTTEKRNQIVENTKKAIQSIYQGCKGLKEEDRADGFRISVKCKEGNLGFLVKDTYLKKYEYDIYQLISAPEDLLASLEGNNVKFNQIQDYLYKQFFDSEILFQKDNVFAYIQEIETETKPEAGYTYPFDASTAKTIESLKAAQANNNKNNGSNASSEDRNKNDIANSPMITTSSSDDLFSLDNLLTFGGIGAIIIALVVLFLLRNHIKSKIVPYVQKKVAEKEQLRQTGFSANDNSSELIAEIEEERIRREKERYKQQKEAEKLAKELEARKQNETEEERAKRIASLNEFVQKSSVIPGVSSPDINTENAVPATEQNVEKAQEPTENSVPKSNVNETAPAAKPKEETSNPPAETSANHTPAPVESSNVKKEEVHPAETDEEAERRKAEEERIQREKEFQSKKLKGEDLLMKMKMKQKQNTSESSSEENKQKEQQTVQEPPKFNPNRFSLVGETKKAPEETINKEEPVVQETESKIDEDYDPSKDNTIIPAFSNDDFVIPSEPEKKEEPIKDTPHVKAKNPFDALVTKGDPSKYSSFSQKTQEDTSNELEIDLSDADIRGLSEDTLFGSDNDTIQKYDESNEINLDAGTSSSDNEISISAEQGDQLEQFIIEEDNTDDIQIDEKDYNNINQNIFTDDNMVQPVEEPAFASVESQDSYTIKEEPVPNSAAFENKTAQTYDTDTVQQNLDSSYQNDNSINAETFDNSVSAPENQNTEQNIAQQPAEEVKPKKKSSKRVRRFNMGSLSISLHDE